MLSLLNDLRRALTEHHAQLDSDSPDPLLQPPTVAHSSDRVAEMISQWAKTQPRWSVESREELETGIALHLTRRTRTVRFVDDIYVQIVADGESSRVEAESQSRIGKGDLGQNARNLRELVGFLNSYR